MEATTRRAERTLPSLVMSRVFDAPIDLMFRVWTEPEHMLRWWAPHDFTVPHAEFDARPGGRLRIDFRSPDGFVFANYGDVKEVSPPHRLVFTTEYREGGKLMVVSLVTATFESEGQKTRVTIRADVTFAEPEAAASLAGMEEGWNQQIDKLELHAAHAAAADLAGLAIVTPMDRPVVLMRRRFEAPRELVWNCFTRPEHLAAWWGPQGHVIIISEMNPSKGGRYRVEQRDPKGNLHVFFGTYRDVTAPERLVNTFEMEGPYGGKQVLNTQIFEEIADGTQLTAISRFESVEQRNHAAAGVEWGARQAYDRLSALIESLQEGAVQ
jgi:uncharacterized protein YndB with AHSA1/START domain